MSLAIAHVSGLNILRLLSDLRIDRNTQVCSGMSQAAERNIHLRRPPYRRGAVSAPLPCGQFYEIHKMLNLYSA